MCNNQSPETASEASATISEARLAANRRNAQFSTGAKSPETQANSAQNHTIHGLARKDEANFKLLTTEDPAAFAALQKAFNDEHRPTTETELTLVNRMAESEWLTRRAQRLLDNFIHPDTGLVTDEKHFNLYMRYKNAHTRAFHKCLSDLLKLRSEKRKENLGFEAQRVKSERLKMQKAKQDLQLFILQCECENNEMKTTQEFMRAAKENPGFEAQFESLFGKRQAA